MPKTLIGNKKPNVIYLILRFLFGKYSVFEATSVFEAAIKKTDSGTEAKTEGL